MNSEEIKSGLSKLGYSDRWMEYGFLDEETLRRQLLIFDSGEDRVTEHYRYAAFCSLLDRTAIDKVDLDHYLDLIEAEPDDATALSVRMLVIHWPGLSASQRTKLRQHPSFAEGKYQREFLIYSLAEELTDKSITHDLYRRCMDTGDETLQRKIVEHHGASRKHIEPLVEGGKSKAVRNMAAARLRRMDAAEQAEESS